MVEFLHNQCWAPQNAKGGELIVSAIKDLHCLIGSKKSRRIMSFTFTYTRTAFNQFHKICDNQKEMFTASKAAESCSLNPGYPVADLAFIHMPQIKGVVYGHRGLRWSAAVNWQAGIGKMFVISRFLKEKYLKIQLLRDLLFLRVKQKQVVLAGLIA